MTLLHGLEKLCNFLLYQHPVHHPDGHTQSPRTSWVLVHAAQSAHPHRPLPHQYLVNKQAVLSTHSQWQSPVIPSLHQALQLLWTTLQHYGYSKWHILQSQSTLCTASNLGGFLCQHHLQLHLQSVDEHNINTVDLRSRKFPNFLWPVKDNKVLKKKKGVHGSPWVRDGDHWTKWMLN
jgi:hypothetical protein